MGQALHHPQGYRSGIKAGISATPSWFTSSAIISVTYTGTLSFAIISWVAIDSCFTAVSWFTSSASTKEAKIGIEVASIV